jgi:hypothetical protein
MWDLKTVCPDSGYASCGNRGINPKEKSSPGLMLFRMRSFFMPVQNGRMNQL